MRLLLHEAAKDIHPQVIMRLDTDISRRPYNIPRSHVYYCFAEVMLAAMWDCTEIVVIAAPPS